MNLRAAYAAAARPDSRKQRWRVLCRTVQVVNPMTNPLHRTDMRAGAPMLTHLLRALWREVRDDHARVIAAGLAYYAVLGLLPAAVAL